jgi:TonB family protein
VALPYAKLLIVLGVALAAPRAWSTNPHEIEQKLKAALQDKVITLKKFYIGNHLRYSTDGTLESSAEPCPWTLCSKVFVEGVKIEEDRLILDCKRVVLSFEGKPLDAKHLRTREPVKIEVVSLSGPDEFIQAVPNIFLSPSTRLSDLVPAYWRNIVTRMEEGKSIELGKDEKSNFVSPGVFKVEKGGVTAPRIKRAPDPAYSRFARAAKKQGTIVLWGVVQEDGKMHDMRIVRRLGFGLEEEAVKAIETWEFQPGRKAGQPVPVQLNIEINFRF